jgi:hypothetical protein
MTAIDKIKPEQSEFVKNTLAFLNDSSNKIKSMTEKQYSVWGQKLVDIIFDACDLLDARDAEIRVLKQCKEAVDVRDGLAIVVAKDYYEDMETEIKELKAKQGIQWISVKDRLPENYKTVVASNGQTFCKAKYINDWIIISCDYAMSPEEITHFAYLNLPESKQ